MNPRSFTLSYDVPRTPEEIVAAIGDPRSWWSGDIDGPTATVGDEFDYRFQDIHRTRIRVTEVTSAKVVWEVLDNHMSFIEDSTEWIGTHVVFELEPTGAGTRVTFTHDGLVPEFECYDACQQGWSTYASASLRALLTTGTGNPNGADARP